VRRAFRNPAFAAALRVKALNQIFDRRAHVSLLSLSKRSATRQRSCSKNQNGAPKMLAIAVSTAKNAKLTGLCAASLPSLPRFFSLALFISASDPVRLGVTVDVAGDESHELPEAHMRNRSGL
jgi:hypothetical protein